MAASQKQIEFTAHADAQMAARAVSRNQVANTIRQPTTKKAGNTQYTQRLERDFPPNRRLVVIVEELGDKIKVVTTYWQQITK
ncbi:MAG TPA: DUF4258 domain-containing protein [Pirellulales bacterium]|nr:DUF4258 domain-containing protein [Pirellulales bacterium]